MKITEDGATGSITYSHVDGTTRIPSELLVSSVRVDKSGAHEIVTVWNRGGQAGTIVVDARDGNAIAQRIMATTLTELTEADTALGEMRDLIVKLAGGVPFDRESREILESNCHLLASRMGWL